MANYDNNDEKKVGGSDMECLATATRRGKPQVWPLTDHIERLIEEACPNHVYPIKHKINYSGRMKNFMTLGSLTRDKEPEEDQSGSDAMPFPREDVVMTVCGGHPAPGRRRVSILSPRTSNRCCWGLGNAGV
jgi:hypothetical protein